MNCPYCNTDRAPHKHGKDRQGFDRYKCPACNKTFTSNPNPKKAGRKMLGDKPMTSTERKRKSRAEKKKKELGN